MRSVTIGPGLIMFILIPLNHNVNIISSIYHFLLFALLFGNNLHHHFQCRFAHAIIHKTLQRRSASNRCDENDVTVNLLQVAKSLLGHHILAVNINLGHLNKFCNLLNSLLA